MIRLYDTTGRQTATLPQSDKGDRIAFSPDGAWLVFGNWEGPLHVLDVVKREESFRLEGHTDYITRLAFSPDGCWLASSSSSYGQTWEPRKEDRSIRLWDFQKRAQTRCWTRGWETTASLTFLADSQHLVAFHDPHGEAILTLWSVAGDGPLATWSPGEGTTAVAIWSAATASQPTSGLIATGHEDGAIQLWDIADVLPAPRVGRTPASATTKSAPDEYAEFFPT